MSRWDYNSKMVGWVTEYTPNQIGWYAVLLADADDNTTPSGEFFDGAKWSSDRVAAYRYPVRCNEEDAYYAAREFDPDL